MTAIVNELEELDQEQSEIVFCSEFLEFKSSNMQITKNILDFTMETFAKCHQLNFIGYLVQDHYIGYFTKRLIKAPSNKELKNLNEKFISATKMLRIFLSDKKKNITELR